MFEHRQDEEMMYFRAFGDLHYRARDEWHAMHSRRLAPMFEDTRAVIERGRTRVLRFAGRYCGHGRAGELYAGEERGIPAGIATVCRDAGWVVGTLVGVPRCCIHISCFITRATMWTDGNEGRPQGSLQTGACRAASECLLSFTPEYRPPDHPVTGGRWLKWRGD